MKHHFGDLLDRTGDYWTIVPNVERYSYSAGRKIRDREKVKVLTISKDDQHWQQVFDCPNLEELTLHDPGKAQVEAIQELQQLKRLRVTFLRTKDILFIGNLLNLEELILEYVSGFSDLSPLQKLRKLKSLHLENLRRVSNFDGLSGIRSLRYLHIDGTPDRSQPVDNFEFLSELPALEVLALGFVMNKTAFPAFLPMAKLKHIKMIKAGMATFATQEYAFLETAFPEAICCQFGGTPWTPCYQISDGYLEFIGKRAGKVNLKSADADKKIRAFEKKYEDYKAESQKIIRAAKR